MLQTTSLCANYSHTGNEIFPRWEQNVPMLGTLMESHRLIDRLRLSEHKKPLLFNKRTHVAQEKTHIMIGHIRLIDKYNSRGRVEDK